MYGRYYSVSFLDVGSFHMTIISIANKLTIHAASAVLKFSCEMDMPTTLTIPENILIDRH